MALAQRRSSRDLLHHSDQGYLYTSEDYLALLARYNNTVSMSHTGDCYDNTLTKSVWGTLKAECASARFATHAAARVAMFDCPEVWHNCQRLHPALDHTSPATYESQQALPFF